MDVVRRTFDLDTIALLRRTEAGRQAQAAAGAPLPATPDEAPFSAELSDGCVLVMAVDRLTARDAQLLGPSPPSCASTQLDRLHRQ
ncbi:hypothetical protein LN042_11720 [Kitasatospora sp. RB6PN24]|uniref:hypothetical protein n=1 Tax=Kitasatospora humi TaxID=2893891 RepID=UPI001E414C9C|nr:hypothetical protein [Kitasatospora humi]MCC9307756.1 hypothetical protein [Kitasatospora humi]